MSWRLAKSLIRLREQINAAYPNRDKASDGSIGDARHSASKSDHNPNAAGVVTAIDIDKDLSATQKVEIIVNALVEARDPRIKYIIWRGRIISSQVSPWVWRKYTGANGHFEHVHISVGPSATLYDDARDWNIGTGFDPEIADKYTVKAGDSLWKIAAVNNTTVHMLRKLNSLPGDLIKPGQILRLR